MEVRRLTEADAEAFWNIRLRALRDDPESFGASYTEILERGIAGITQGLGKSERAADDGVVPQHGAGGQAAAGGEDREPGAGARAARGPVDLAVGEDRHVALVKSGELLVEDGAVDARQPLVGRMPSDVGA